MNSSAVILLSGGQDSCACLFAAKQNYEKVFAISIDYGQSHAREIGAAERLARIAQVEFEVIKLPPLLSASPLTQGADKLERYSSFEQMQQIIGDRVEHTFVPMRNSVMLMLAANRAVAHGARSIVAGVCEADEANYPDCRGEYLAKMQEAINLSLGTPDHIYIYAPLLHKKKSQTVIWQYEMGMPAFAALAFTHTAYDGSYPPTGDDHASILRAQGFLEAKLPDPLILLAHMQGLMELPISENYRNPSLNQEIREAIKRAGKL